MKTVKHLVVATGKYIGDSIELEITAEKYKGCTFYYGATKFADEENDDGTINMTFEKTITNDFVPEDDLAFNIFLGETLLEILKAQIENNEVVYKGGV